MTAGAPAWAATALAYAGAALAEIAGCFAVWAVLRQGAHPAWLAAGLGCLGVFAWVLTLAPAAAAGRAFAAYGGVYIAASLLWLWAVEGEPPLSSDLLGALLCLAGAAVILAPAVARGGP